MGVVTGQAGRHDRRLSRPDGGDKAAAGDCQSWDLYELDIVSVAILRHQLGGIAGGSIRKLIIDLTRCAYVDTAGIAELVAAYRHSLATGFRLTLVIPASLMRLFGTVGITERCLR
jgi:ABC-type transporter Mla MlaB component